MTNGNGNGENAPLDALHETAARGVEAIHIIVQQRDELLKQVDRLSVHNALLQERLNQREAALATSSAERDHYMRYTTELTARLNNILTLINSTIEESKRAAYRPTSVLSTQHVPKADIEELQQLIQKLPYSGGDSVETK